MMIESTPTSLENNKKMDFPINSNQNQMDDEKSTIQQRKKYWEENSKTSFKNDSQRQVEIIQRQNSSSSEEEKIPEIKDIYDHIYGIVQSKKVFYEGKRDKTNNEQNTSTNGENISDIENSKDNNTNNGELFKTTSLATPKSADILSVDKGNLEAPLANGNNGDDSFIKDLSPSSTFSNNTVIEKNTLNNSQDDTKFDKTLKVDAPSSSVTVTIKKNDLEEPQKVVKSDEVTEVDDLSATTTPVNSPFLGKKILKDEQIIHVLPKSYENTCNKCQKADFINDRSEVLTEINANLKLELENVKQDLKKEMAKNNELNFEIANIEAALENYYKEAKNQKSTLSSIYSAMKNYVSDQKTDFQQNYTYSRIKMIADYIESLKNKLEHQDRIIKNNFIENPYYTDLIIKHEAVLKQLDDMSKVNEELKEEIKTKSAEELDIIKELNRQKFQLENKCKEMENYYRNEIITKEALIGTVEDEYKKQLEDFQTVLDKKDEEMAKVQKTATARINNYKQELVIVYRKWKEQKFLNSVNKKNG